MRAADEAMTPATAVLLLISVTALLRIFMGVELGLGIDESYMVAAGRTLQFGYFDHPPLSWWLSAGAARLFGTEVPVVVRLPFIVLFAASTWLLYLLTARLFSRRAGLWAALCINLAPVLGVTTGGWVLPDGPLVCALLAAAYCLVRALEQEDGWRWWLGAGIAAGLALLSKYTAVLSLGGVGLYLLTQQRHRPWLARPQPWAALLLAAFAFAPVLAWNARHGWVSFAFQGGRAAGRQLILLGPVATLGGEALFLLPWIWAPLMICFIAGLRAGRPAWKSWFLCCLAAPPIVLFAVVSLWSRNVLFHWATPGYLFLFPLLGSAVERVRLGRPTLVRAWLSGSAVLVLVGLFAVVAEVRWHWLGAFVPGFDPAVQAMDWTEMRGELAARGLLGRPDTAVAGTAWYNTGKIDYALGGAARVFCLNPDARQYALLGDPPPGSDVLIVAPRESLERVQANYGTRFASIEALPPLLLHRAPGSVAEVPLYLGRDLKPR